jgi:NADH-quinone oxidoreductase subunit E
MDEVIKGVDQERRELVGKRKGTGFFDLVKKDDGDYRCYSCTLCEKTCPVDCIKLEYCPEFAEEPFDYEAARVAALAVGPGESCGAASACVMGENPVGYRPPLDMRKFDPVVAGLRAGSGLVEALHATQDAFGYLPRVALESIADEMHLPFSRIYGVASFYGQFRLSPVGKHVIDVCVGTACHVAGAPLVVEAFSQDLGIPVGGTTPDGLFTLQTVNCVGACALAPVVRLGADTTLGRMGPNEARRLVRKLRKQEAGS